MIVDVDNLGDPIDPSVQEAIGNQMHDCTPRLAKDDIDMLLPRTEQMASAPENN